MERNNNITGFSVNELLIVIVMLGVLTAIAVPVMKRVELAAREKRAIATIKTLINSQTAFYSTNRRFAIPDELYLSGYVNEGQLSRRSQGQRGRALTAASEALSDGCYDYSFRYDRDSQGFTIDADPKPAYRARLRWFRYRYLRTASTDKGSANNWQVAAPVSAESKPAQDSYVNFQP